MRTPFQIRQYATRPSWRWPLALVVAAGLALMLFAQAQAFGACATPTQTLELWAKAGTHTLPDASTVPIWGYSASAAGAAQLPGPMLTITQGTCVQVILHNDLAEPTSLALHGQGLAADLTGAAPAGTATYTFLASQAGTFLYEAGLTANVARQVAMGLYGALIVQPATPAVNYSGEAVLVLSEIDPDLNAAPTTFDMGDYHPRYWLINGQGYPNIPDVAFTTGVTARVRYINAGLNENSLGTLGLDQMVFAADGFAIPNPYGVVAETIPPGATLDTLVTIPAGTAVGARFALYSTAHRLDNNGASYGGQITFIAATAPLAPLPAPAGTGDKQPVPADASAPAPVDVAKP